jgi:hypothetical protein
LKAARADLRLHDVAVADLVEGVRHEIAVDELALQRLFRQVARRAPVLDHLLVQVGSGDPEVEARQAFHQVRRDGVRLGPVRAGEHHDLQRAALRGAAEVIEHGARERLELAGGSVEAGVSVALCALAGGQQPGVLQDAVRIRDGPIEDLRLQEPVGVAEQRALATVEVTGAVLVERNGTWHGRNLAA